MQEIGGVTDGMEEVDGAFDIEGCVLGLMDGSNEGSSEGSPDGKELG